MPHQKWPPSLSRFIQCGSLPGGRRRKKLAAHVTTEPKRVVTWAARATAIYFVTLRINVVSGVVPLEPLHQAPKFADIRAQSRPMFPWSVISARVQTTNHQASDKNHPRFGLISL